MTVTPKIADIQRAVAEHFGIPLEKMRSPQRMREFARPRQIAMYLARELTPLSFPIIGRHFGGRDHTTIMHAVRKITELREIDTYIREHEQFICDAIDAILAKLTPQPDADPRQHKLQLVA